MNQSTAPDNISHGLLDNSRFWCCVLLGASMIRLLVAGIHPLFETECYYWMYSYNIDFGYFDHPPLLGVFLRLFDFWDPPSSLAARFHCVVDHFLCSILLYWYARNQFHSARAGIRTALLFNVIPIYSIMAIQNQPDAPLLLFWCATLLCFERSLATDKPLWWLLVGGSAGGALLSKFHAVPLVGSLLLHVIFFSKDRRCLTSPWPYLAGALAIACYLPNLWWNSQHGWVTYDFQLFHHAVGGEFKLVHLVGVLLAPFLLLSPWVYGYLAQTALRASKRCVVDMDRIVALGFWSSVPLFVFFVIVSFTKSVKLHWTAPAFIGLLPLMAAGLEKWTVPRRTSLYASAGTISVLTYLYLAHPFPLRLSLPKSCLPSALEQKVAGYLKEDWSVHIYGYDQLGAFLKSKIEDDDSVGFDLIASRRFDRASIAAFYAGHPERAFVPAYGDRRGYTLWPSVYAKPGANALYVYKERSTVARRDREMSELRNDFDAVGDPFEIETLRKGHPLRRFLVYPCYGLKDEALANLNSPAFQHTAESRSPPPVRDSSPPPQDRQVFSSFSGRVNASLAR